MEPWHCDVFEFLDLKKNTGKEENRARDLFYALWIPDIFMRRVEADGDWCLMCPHECPGLFDCWGDEFDALYQKYVPHELPTNFLDFKDSRYKVIFLFLLINISITTSNMIRFKVASV